MKKNNGAAFKAWREKNENMFFHDVNKTENRQLSGGVGFFQSAGKEESVALAKARIEKFEKNYRQIEHPGLKKP